MATALQSFRLTARSCTCRGISHHYIIKSTGRRRAFSTTAIRGQEDGPGKDGDVISKIEKKIKSDPGSYRYANLMSEEMYKELQDSDRLMKEEIIRETDIDEDLDSGAPTKKPSAKIKRTFLNMGEDELIEEEEDVDDSDGISTLGHGELEAHREKRHYARLAAWEMPLLAKMAKPFVPPTPDMPLRFRYTTYMGEQHPAEKKVVLEFCIADMPDLTQLQRGKLRKLVGVRYNPETDIVKMSCEMFESQAQNKRYLGDRVDELLKEARDPTDTFEDIPLDTRHHTFKRKPQFPKAWKMTAKRAEELRAHREQAALKDQEKMIAGQIVDGVKQIESAWARVPEPASEALPEMVSANRGTKGKTPKRVAMRR